MPVPACEDCRLHGESNRAPAAHLPMTIMLRTEVQAPSTPARAGTSWRLSTSAAHSASRMISEMSSARMLVGRGTVTAPLHDQQVPHQVRAGCTGGPAECRCAADALLRARKLHSCTPHNDGPTVKSLQE